MSTSAPTPSPEPTGTEPRADQSQAANGPENTPGGSETFTREYVSGLRSEAARYRTERNAATEQRDQLQQRVERYDTDRVAEIAGARLRDPRDLTDNLDLSTVRAEDGTIDSAAVEGRITALIESRPHYAKEPGPAHRDFGQGQRGGSGQSAPSFGERLKNLGR